MEHILDLTKQASELHEIFRKIHDGNTILFLGAGASVGEKRYLSKEIIEYYESFLGRTLNESNITKFVDILSADDKFSRSHFDDFVANIIQKLTVTEGHKILATVPWREIITTNYDLLIERAYDEIASSSQKVYDLKVVRNLRQYNYRESNTEIKYIKLNGCLQDKSLYPLAFSTDDFTHLKSFYKNILNDLKNLSPEISFLSIGYSYSDAFGKELLDKFDSYNFRDKKWMINVDPFPNESALSFYKKSKICIIKSSFQDFFKKYKEWVVQQDSTLVKKRGLSISDSQNHYITLPSRLLLNLDGVVRQLNVFTKERFIKDSEYYKGEEPNFNIITRGVDVIKQSQVEKCKNLISEVFGNNHSTFVPIFFITGDFGIGKSTFTLRVIYELEKDPDLKLVAFEIVDFNNIKREWLKELVDGCKAKNVVFFCDEMEIESYFKSLIDIQRDLSIEQFQDCNVFFIVPIRENILEKFRLARLIPRSFVYRIDATFEENELDELLEKLKKSELILFRDSAEKNRLIKKIQNDYDSDSFVSLMSIITSGKHENDLISSYDQLSTDAQKAFLYTALIHKYKLLMPATWLKQNISMSWEEFTIKIIKAEGKGLLIQEIRSSHGTQPDLYFRTKHPIIAQKLVDRFLPNKDKQFGFYERMLKTIEPGQTNSYLVNNLLKAFIRNEVYNSFQLDKLFDAGYTKLSDDPYFLLSYSTNLQLRKTETDLKKALELLIYAESLLDFRNHRFMHRRGVINFELAKLYFKDDDRLNNVSFYLREARELFMTKQLIDPFSSYSYVDYIKLLIWELENIEKDEEDDVQLQIQIEELFDVANRTVTDGIVLIDTLRARYAEYLSGISDKNDYKEYLDKLYENFRMRPYACILLFNYYSTRDESKLNTLVEEMQIYQDNFEVIKFLFKYYGRRLFDPNMRVKLLHISRDNPALENENLLRFNYFNFMAETYNYHYFEGKKYLHNIESKFYSLNPEFHSVWLDPSGNVQLFDARVIKNNGEKFKAVKISSIQQTIRLVKGNYDKYVLGTEVKVKVHFYLYGLMAEIVEER